MREREGSWAWKVNERQWACEFNWWNRDWLDCYATSSLLHLEISQSLISYERESKTSNPCCWCTERTSSCPSSYSEPVPSGSEAESTPEILRNRRLPTHTLVRQAFHPPPHSSIDLLTGLFHFESMWDVALRQASSSCFSLVDFDLKRVIFLPHARAFSMLLLRCLVLCILLPSSRRWLRRLAIVRAILIH